MSNSWVSFITKWAKNSYGIKTPEHRLSIIEWNLAEYAKKSGISPHAIVAEINNGNETVISNVVDLLTIQESYFFRDRALFTYLENNLLSELVKRARRSGKKRLDIGSFGCSRGEEIYSIAMLLMELIPDLDSWKIFLLGVDINRFALDLAKQAKYTPSSLRAIESRFKEKYFVEEGGYYYLNEKIRFMVRFNYGNIVECELMPLRFDLILCRNVFIYFEESDIRKGLQGFDKLLKEDGVLFLAPSEYSYFAQWFRKSFIDGVSFLSKVVPVSSGGVAKTSSFPQVAQKTSYISKQSTKSALINEIKQLLEEKNYSKALEKINVNLHQFSDAVLLNQYKARALLELGDTLSARELLTGLLKQDDLNATYHFLLGLSYSEEDSNLSMEHYKKAVYLNINFPEAYYYLANMYFSKQDLTNGLLYLDKSIRYARAKVADEQALVGDCDYATLLGILQKERDYYARKG